MVVLTLIEGYKGRKVVPIPIILVANMVGYATVEC